MEGAEFGVGYYGGTDGGVGDLYSGTNTLEVGIEERGCDLVKEHLGIESIKINTRTETGWPDRMFLVPIIPVFIEVKQPGEPLRAKQERVHARLKKLKYSVHTCTSEYEIFGVVLKHIERLIRQKILKLNKEQMRTLKQAQHFYKLWG